MKEQAADEVVGLFLFPFLICQMINESNGFGGGQNMAAHLLETGW